MAASATLTNYFKLCLANGEVHLTDDVIKVLLMRDGFVFDKEVHEMKKHIINSKVASTIGVNAALAFVDSGNGFITAGFVPGMEIITTGFVTNAGNNATKIISTVAAGVIVVTDTTGLVEEAASEAITMVGNDELATLYGYVRDTKVLASKVVAQDNGNDRAEMTCTDPSWTASGGSIGPTPGAILYDDTHSDNIIIGYLDFGTDQTVTTGLAFTLEDVVIRVN